MTFRATVLLCSTPYGINGIFTIESVKLIGVPEECSTPYGINGIFTVRYVSQHRHSNRVLNALRHQWNLHSNVQAEINPATRVLNALRHQWNLHAALRLVASSSSWSAQRLTASMESSPRSSPAGGVGDSCSTPYGINGIFTNAVKSNSKQYKMCSTPYGINGIFTLPKPQRVLVATVLNALRHQWNLHIR